MRKPEALLRLAQLALQAVALAHVADAAVRPGEPAVLVAPGEGDELGRDRVAVPWSRLTRPRSSRPPVPSSSPIRGPVDLGDLPRRLVDERPEVLAEELLGRQPVRPLARVRDEREPRVRVDRPDEVRRVLDEVAVAGLGFAEELVQVRVRQGDRRLVGEALEEVELVGQRSRAARRYETASVPMTSPPGARSGAAAIARSRSRSAARSSSGSCGIRGSVGVVVGPDRAGPPRRRGR